MPKALIQNKTPARRRNAAATREAILASAREAFARVGYDGAGVREIAAGAGVTAMLVNRYFGSKEQLFAEVIAATIGQSHHPDAAESQILQTWRNHCRHARPAPPEAHAREVSRI